MRALLGAGNQNLSPTGGVALVLAKPRSSGGRGDPAGACEGCIGVFDRFTDSTLVYQGYARGLGREVAPALDKVACRDPKPITAWREPERVKLIDAGQTPAAGGASVAAVVAGFYFARKSG
ncbi:MAG: hypothetical protein IT165_31455 [Bryobacterales bacterium]|nr:hypothetical protein [Bryobacterales bacterium]